MTQEILVFVSCPQSLAESIAITLVTEKMAACVSIIDQARSIYSWQGKICDERESVLLIKTHKNKYTELEKRIKTLHSYEVPEILAVPIEAGYAPYLDWINESIGVTK